jgi:hypothetical protein
VLAKQHLVGLKDSILNQLADQGVLVKPREKAMHESVLPWLIDKMTGFLDDEDDIDYNVEEVVNDSYKKGLEAHSKSIRGEKKRKEDLIYSAEQRIIQKELER